MIKWLFVFLMVGLLGGFASAAGSYVWPGAAQSYIHLANRGDTTSVTLDRSSLESFLTTASLSGLGLTTSSLDGRYARLVGGNFISGNQEFIIPSDGHFGVFEATDSYGFKIDNGAAFKITHNMNTDLDLVTRWTWGGVQHASLSGITGDFRTTGSVTAAAGFFGNLTGGVTGTASGNELPLTFAYPLVRTVNAVKATTASTTTPGVISAAIFNTFNNKEPAITGDGESTHYFGGDKAFHAFSVAVDLSAYRTQTYLDSHYVETTGTETIAGHKTFSDDMTINGEVFGSEAWYLNVTDDVGLSVTLGAASPDNSSAIWGDAREVAGGMGVYGYGPADSGGTSPSGVFGRCDAGNGSGVWGQGDVLGVYGDATGPGGIGVDGLAEGVGGIGVYGQAQGVGSVGVSGQAIDSAADEFRGMNGSAYNFRVTSAGNVRTSGTIVAAGTITGSNLSGTNTGDQDLSSYLTSSAAAAAYQPLDSDLTYLAGFTPAANVKSILNAADYAAIKVLLSLGNVENTALSTWAGTANIVTVGTIATGTWGGTTIAVNKGGTGATSLADLIPLGTDTTGNYVATIAAGTGISGSSSTEGGTPTIAIDTAVVPRLAVANVFSALNTFNLTPTGTGAGQGSLYVNPASNGATGRTLACFAINGTSKHLFTVDGDYYAGRNILLGASGDYYAADSTQGASGTFESVGGNIVRVKNGIITNLDE